MYFKKKPVTIEARQWDGSDAQALELITWMGSGHTTTFNELVITTLEDGKDGSCVHVASPGDWIIKGVRGEFYPCRSDIFDATYVRV